MENVIGRLNQGFINTQIAIRIHLHCIERYFGPETNLTYYDLRYDYKVSSCAHTSTSHMYLISCQFQIWHFLRVLALTLQQPTGFLLQLGYVLNWYAFC